MRFAPLTAGLLLVAAPFVHAQSPAAAADAKPLAVVNGKEIPALYGELLRREMTQVQLPPAQLEARVRDSLINLELLSRAAIDQGLDRDPALAAAIDIRRKDALAKAYLDQVIRNKPITDAEINALYEKAKAEPVEAEYRARHILVPTEAEARRILAALARGGKFDDLAKRLSKDPGSAKNGGLLDWAEADSYVKEFADALKSMKKGETSKTPVKTEFGFHIIRLEDVRKPEFPPLEAVRGEIVRQLQQERIREAVAAVRAGAKIE